MDYISPYEYDHWLHTYLLLVALLILIIVLKSPLTSRLTRPDDVTMWSFRKAKERNTHKFLADMVFAGSPLLLDRRSLPYLVLMLVSQSLTEVPAEREHRY